MEKTPLRLRLRNRGAFFDVIIPVWRKYATILRNDIVHKCGKEGNILM
jgi:hypothetical protein